MAAAMSAGGLPTTGMPPSYHSGPTSATGMSESTNVASSLQPPFARSVRI